jgi:NAD(P)H-hydrate epimerase
MFARKIFSKLLPSRKLDSHKGNYGHILVLAGSAGLTGAAFLCSQGALLCGSGLVTLGIPEGLNSIMEVKLTEVMTKPLAQTKDFSLSLHAQAQIIKFLEKVDAVAIGPGLSRNEETQELIRRLIVLIDKPFVVDADGINALAGYLGILTEKKSLEERAKLVLTPHVGEMSRLIGLNIREVEKNREEIVSRLADRLKTTVVLKGYRTVVAASGEKVYINSTGNPGMATAGAGDVLTGMIASFLGQRIKPFKAAKLAVYLHGLAGDLAAKKKGQISLIATDILNEIPEAIKRSS